MSETTAFYVYMVQCADGTFYTGWTKDVQRRLNEHNNSERGARYTRSRRPVELVYVEQQQDHVSALKREIVIKRKSRKQKSSLIENDLNQLDQYR